MITEGQWKRWKDNSTTDDRLNTYVLSDIRQMLGEIERLRRLYAPDNYDISQTVDGEWRTPPMESFYRACCDCGLVHKEEYRIQHGRVQYRVTRDREETHLERERTGKNAAPRLLSTSDQTGSK